MLAMIVPPMPNRAKQAALVVGVIAGAFGIATLLNRRRTKRTRTSSGAGTEHERSDGPHESANAEHR